MIAKTLAVNGVNGTPLSPENNQADYQVTAMGRRTANAVATDAAGFTAADSVSFMAYDLNDAAPPIATLGRTDCAYVADLYSVTGTVSDAGPVYYGLYFRKRGESAWIPLG